MKEILCSGLSGFVGKNLQLHLQKKGHVISGVKHHDLPKYTDEVLIKSNNRRRHAIFIHLAGKAHEVHGNSNFADYDKSNYELTRFFFDAFCNSEAKIFIFLSSVKAAADKVPGVLRESDSEEPKTPYGISKLKAERYLLQHLPEGKKVYILRPCMIHGPSNKGNLNLLYSIVAKGIPWPLAAFENKRSFLSVENLCVVVEKLLGGNIPSGIYQVADDDPLSTNEVIMLMGESIGRKVKLWHIPKVFIRLLAMLGDVLHLPLNSSRLQKLTESYVVDNHKIKTALQIDLPVNARTGLMQAIKSFQSN